jgi:hypothetical protein
VAPIEEWCVSPTSYRIEVKSPTLHYTVPAAGEQADPSDRESYLADTLLAMTIGRAFDPSKLKDQLVGEEDREIHNMRLKCEQVASGPMLGSAYCAQPETDILRLQSFGDESSIHNKIVVFQGVNLGTDVALFYYGQLAIVGHVDRIESYDPQKTPVELFKLEPPTATTISSSKERNAQEISDLAR